MNQDLQNIVDDLVTRFLWDDRKEDEDFPRGRIERMVDAGEVSADEIADRFRAELKASLDL